MKTVFEGLMQYFASNSPEQIQKDWDSIESYEGVSPTIEEFMLQHQYFTKLVQFEQEPFYNLSIINPVIKNPKFSSDFLLLLPA